MKTSAENSQAIERAPAKLFGPFKAVQDMIGTGWIVIDKYENPLWSEFPDQTTAEKVAQALTYYL